MSTKEFVTFDGTVTRETEKAVLFVFSDTTLPVVSTWFPLSQVEKIFTPVDPNETGYIIVSKWIAITKELI